MSSLAHYARAIETRWAALVERPVVFGERDWSFISDWHARGIPLALVGEAMDSLEETFSRKRGRPRGLAVLAPRVEDGWRAVEAGRLATAPPTGAAAEPAEDPARNWRVRARALGAGDPLGAFLGRLLDRLDAGADAAACDAALAAGLVERLPDALRDELTQTVEAGLREFRGRMAADVWDATRERALVSAARRRLDLPRLTGRAVP